MGVCAFMSIFLLSSDYAACAVLAGWGTVSVFFVRPETMLCAGLAGWGSVCVFL